MLPIILHGGLDYYDAVDAVQAWLWGVCTVGSRERESGMSPPPRLSLFLSSPKQQTQRERESGDRDRHNSTQHTTIIPHRMPPKGSNNSKKREAEGDSTTAASGDSNSLRRSTRGRGHPAAASANEKPASQPKPRSSKKAKVEGEGETATAPAEEEPAAGEDTNVAVPEENKEIAAAAAQQNGKSKRLEVGETLPAGLVLKNEMDQDVKVEELTREKGAVFFVYPKVRELLCCGVVWLVLMLMLMPSPQCDAAAWHALALDRQTPQDALLRHATLEINTASLDPWATRVS